MPAEKLEAVKDVAIGLGAASSPVWAVPPEKLAGFIMVYGGAALVLKRLGLWCLIKRFWCRLLGKPYDQD